MDIDANDLILFAKLMEVGSFTGAAELMKVPKSSLSRRIALLENRLGEKLLVRTTRRLSITPFGENILEHAKRLLEETEVVSALVLNQQGIPKGKLRVSLPPDFVEFDLTQLLLKFSSHYPEVSLELDLSPRRVDLVAERFDLAVRVASYLPDDNTLVARKLSEFKNGLYASPAYLARYGNPTSPDDLSGHIGLRLVNGVGETLPWHLSRASEQSVVTPTGPLAANSPGLQRNLAMHGMGIVGLADRLVIPWLEQGLLVRVLPEWSLPTVTVWCVTPGRRLLPTRTLAFIDLLKSHLTSPLV